MKRTLIHKYAIVALACAFCLLRKASGTRHSINQEGKKRVSLCPITSPGPAARDCISDNTASQPNPIHSKSSRFSDNNVDTESESSSAAGSSIEEPSGYGKSRVYSEETFSDRNVAGASKGYNSQQQPSTSSNTQQQPSTSSHEHYSGSRRTGYDPHCTPHTQVADIYQVQSVHADFPFIGLRVHTIYRLL